jgi:hypothetical protein
VECSSSVLQALVTFGGLYPKYRKEEIEKCIGNTAMFLEKQQRHDGSWSLISSCLIISCLCLVSWLNVECVWLMTRLLIIVQVRHLGYLFHLWDALCSERTSCRRKNLRKQFFHKESMQLSIVKAEKNRWMGRNVSF